MQISAEVASILAALTAVAGLGFAWYQRGLVLSQSPGNEKMQKIANAIQLGAQAFLRREYTAIGIMMVVITIVLLALSAVPDSGMSPLTAVAFVVGTVSSGIAGYVGMYIAVRANVRTAQAASESLNQGLRVAFGSGTVMGILVVALGLLGVSILFLIFVSLVAPAEAANALVGFGFGCTLIAIFARVGGGIYTKAADVGADLVGKTEAGIPEDDPRNPAVIADNVGDNVGDVAGMGSDLFESYSSAIIATILIATGLTADESVPRIVFPLLVAAVGILISIGATYLVTTKEGATQEMLLGSLRKGTYSASIGIAIATAILGQILGLGWGAVIATISGLVAGVLIGYFTEYFTAPSYSPTRKLAESSAGGPSIIIIRGLALGMMSTIAPVGVIVAATLVATYYGGLYGVSMAAVGMLSTLGITLATDAYGPVADNAGGIAEMADLPDSVRERTDALDSLGNTTAATGKGFAIGSAAMTALSLIAAFISSAGGNIADLTFAEMIMDTRLITGLFIGAMLPYVFSALTMTAVGDAAQAIVEEVRRQFKTIPGLMEGTADPDYERCVSISTASAIRQMILPGVIAVAVPVVIAVLTILGSGNALGQFVGKFTLMGVLIGSLLSSFMLAVMMANAGGAWDNAKKYIEAGNLGGKGSDEHKAAVIGDTVGDPFKDTSGPSLNILIKMVSIVSLVIAPLLASIP